jgi:hypothetical protein
MPGAVFVRVLLAGLALTAFALAASPAQLPDSPSARLADLVSADPRSRDLEQGEIQYQDGVHEQTMADLAQIYWPENADRLQVTYASFTPESSARPGDDRGYGLHVVKRLDLPVPGGGSRTIYVNEQWPEDKASKGLLLPDEIRIRTQVVSGPRRVKGSEKLYVFDSVRVAWGPFNRESQLARRTVYRRAGNRNQLKVTRTNVSAPLSCAVCHNSGNRLADAFLASGEARNYEAIVQDSHFTLAPDRMRGFRQYIAYLDKSRVDPSTIQRTKAALSQPTAATRVPGLLEVIVSTSKRGMAIWLADDLAVLDSNVELVKANNGVYRDRSGNWWTDAIQDVIEGKYVWWEPVPVIP